MAISRNVTLQHSSYIVNLFFHVGFLFLKPQFEELLQVPSYIMDFHSRSRGNL